MFRSYAVGLSVFGNLSVTYCQVINIDREYQEDSVDQIWGLNATLSVSSDKQRNNLFDISGNAEINRFLKNKWVFLTLLRNDAVINGREVIQNEGMLHLRFRDRDSRKLSPEGYVQYQWNGAWGMLSRNLLGSNVRIRLMEKKTSDLYMASGIFYEWEQWDWRGVKPELVPAAADHRNRSMFRFNLYLKYAVKINEAVDFTAVNYLQFPLSGRLLQPRWYMDANLYIKAGRRLSVVIHWDHVHDLNRVVPIDPFYYSFSTGLQYAW